MSECKEESLTLSNLLTSQSIIKKKKKILIMKNRVRVKAIVFTATFNNISVISWRSVLMVEQTRVPGEIHPPATSH
jgi:hypothetical protein